MTNKKLKICPKCGQLIKYEEKDTYWDDSGSGYSVKLLKCEHCNTRIVLKYEYDAWLKGF